MSDEGLRRAAVAVSEPRGEGLREALVGALEPLTWGHVFPNDKATNRDMTVFAMTVGYLKRHLYERVAATPPAPAQEWPAVDCKVTFLHDHKTPDGYYGPWEGPHDAWDDGSFPDAATPPAPAPDVAADRLADWMMFHIPEYNRWMMTGWRETMRDEAVVLARSMLDAALAPDRQETT